MARLQLVPQRGDVDNFPAGQFRGKLEELMGCLRSADANFVELYAGSIVASVGVLVTDSSPGVGPVTGYAPTGFDSTTDRLDIAANASGTTINDLTAGFDGQRIRIRNTGSTGTLILVNANAGSTAANRFSGPGNVGITPGSIATIVYYAGSVNRWTM